MIPKLANKSGRAVEMYCNSLYYDYSQIEVGKEYSYKELITLIRDEEGNELPEKVSSNGRRRVQLEALGITLDMEEHGTTQNRKYLVKEKRNFSEDEKIYIDEWMSQSYLLTKANTNGLIYEAVLCLLYLKGKQFMDGNRLHTTTEFSKSGWETEVGLVSRVFRKMLYNDDNILTKTIIGNILKISTDEAKKHVFSRALDFIMGNKDMRCEVRTRVLYINEGDKIEGRSGKVGPMQVEYMGHIYDYSIGYADELLSDSIKKVEEQVLEDMGFLNKGAVIGNGKYNKYKKEVATRLSRLNPINSIKGRNGERLSFRNDEGFASKITVLSYWNSYKVTMETSVLEKYVREIINENPMEGFDKRLGDSYLNNYNVVGEYVARLKFELNEFIKNKIAKKVELQRIDPESEAGHALIKEISWLSYFAKHSFYRTFQEDDWNRYLFNEYEMGVNEEGASIVKDARGIVVGVIDENLTYVNTVTGEVVKPQVDDFVAIRELDALTEEIIGENEMVKKVKEEYNVKMDNLIQTSLVLSQKGEVAQTGPDVATMNEKIRELMKMQFLPQADALSYAYQLVKDKRLLAKQLVLKLFEDEEGEG